MSVNSGNRPKRQLNQSKVEPKGSEVTPATVGSLQNHSKFIRLGCCRSRRFHFTPTLGPAPARVTTMAVKITHNFVTVPPVPPVYGVFTGFWIMFFIQLNVAHEEPMAMRALVKRNGGIQYNQSVLVYTQIFPDFYDG
ncbi:hypothetical protein DFH08DRAFT_817413 [Mycena albidolilacea]|uniref:Uncharacterized protein n=1 Tax=Mycena albidolilacea TaxID=1033008 RepID=A0AAD7EIE5_9AGAR|nr:hypothetical protein DFH08DRAFT_817413 [Mycena albidolilacea]